MTETDARQPIVTRHGDYTRYECPICGWDTVFAEEMDRHLDPLRGRHLETFPTSTPSPEARPVALYDAVLGRYRDLVGVVAETQKGRDRLVKDGYAVADGEGALSLTWGVEGIPDAPLGISARKADDEREATRHEPAAADADADVADDDAGDDAPEETE